MRFAQQKINRNGPFGEWIFQDDILRNYVSTKHLAPFKFALKPTNKYSRINWNKLIVTSKYKLNKVPIHFIASTATIPQTKMINIYGRSHIHRVLIWCSVSFFCAIDFNEKKKETVYLNPTISKVLKCLIWQTNRFNFFPHLPLYLLGDYKD